MLAVRAEKMSQQLEQTIFKSISQSPKSPLVEANALSKIRLQIKNGLPIEIVLPAFPAKSSNREKTMGVLPDFGEVLALQNLNALCEEIKRIYSPGAKILICSDGRVFNDLVLVSDTAVNAYQIGIAKIIKNFSLNNLSTYNLDAVFKDCTYAKMRAQLMEDYGNRRRPETSLFNGIHRFIFEDRLVLKPESSREKTRTVAKEIAYEVVRRSQAWSQLVDAHFPSALRLSIHPQSADSEKIGIRLLPSEDIWRTPWHSVVLVQNDTAQLVPHKYALEQKATLHFFEGDYGYFHA